DRCLAPAVAVTDTASSGADVSGTRRARRACAGRARSASAGRRRRGRRRRGSPTTPPSATTAPAASASTAPSLGLALLDDAQRAVRGLLDRELGDVDHGATEPAMELR